MLHVTNEFPSTQNHESWLFACLVPWGSIFPNINNSASLESSFKCLANTKLSAKSTMPLKKWVGLRLATCIWSKVNGSHGNIPFLRYLTQRQELPSLAYLYRDKLTQPRCFTNRTRSNSFPSNIIVSAPLQCQVSCSASAAAYWKLWTFKSKFWHKIMCLLHLKPIKQTFPAETWIW